MLAPDATYCTWTWLFTAALAASFFASSAMMLSECWLVSVVVVSVVVLSVVCAAEWPGRHTCFWLKENRDPACFLREERRPAARWQEEETQPRSLMTRPTDSDTPGDRVRSPAAGTRISWSGSARLNRGFDSWRKRDDQLLWICCHATAATPRGQTRSYTHMVVFVHISSLEFYLTKMKNKQLRRATVKLEYN